VTPVHPRLAGGPAADQGVHPAYAEAAPSLADQGLAPLIAAFTALMLVTPSFESQSSSAFTPCLAYTGMPSFHVARPHSTPEKSTPASLAMRSDSVNCALLTPALR